MGMSRTECKKACEANGLCEGVLLTLDREAYGTCVTCSFDPDDCRHFRLLKSGTVDSLCATKTEHSLTNGNSGGFEDCKNKCALNFACQVFSYWKATKWCQTNRDCDHWTSDRGNDIASYERFKPVSTKARRAQNVSDET